MDAAIARREVSTAWTRAEGPVAWGLALLVLTLYGAGMVDGALLDTRYMDAFIREPDVWYFHDVLLGMNRAFANGDWAGFVDIQHLNYGFPYFFLQWLLLKPFLDGGDLESVVIGMRLFSIAFAVAAAALVFVWVERVGGRPFAALAALVAVVAQFAQWRIAIWAHPDTMMLCFLLLTLLILSRQGGARTALLGGGLFALAMAGKFQALLYAPGVALLLAGPPRGWRVGRLARDAALSVGAFVLVFALTNPQLWSAQGISAFIAFSEMTAQSNQSNHFTFAQTDLSTLWHAVRSAYLPTVATILALALTVVALVRPATRLAALAVLAAGGPAFVYLFFFVNKDWYHYYQPSYVLLCCGAGFGLAVLAQSAGDARLALAPSIAVAAAMAWIGANDLPARIERLALDDPARAARGAALTEAVRGKVPAPPARVLMTVGLPVDIEAAGIAKEQVEFIYGPFNAALYGPSSGAQLARTGLILLGDEDDIFKDTPNPDPHFIARLAATRRVFEIIRSGGHPVFTPCGRAAGVSLFCRR